jgi:hypothetical protein
MVRRLSRRNYRSKKVKSRGSRSLRKRGRSMRKRKRRATKSLKVGGSIAEQVEQAEQEVESEKRKLINGIWDDIPKEKIQTNFLTTGDFFITPNYTTTMRGQYKESNGNNYKLHVKYKGKLKTYKIKYHPTSGYEVVFGAVWTWPTHTPVFFSVSNIGDAIKVLKELDTVEGKDFSNKYINELSFEDYKQKIRSSQYQEQVFFEHTIQVNNIEE